MENAQWQPRLQGQRHFRKPGGLNHQVSMFQSQKVAFPKKDIVTMAKTSPSLADEVYVQAM